jgi:hypothetical protein
MTSASPALPGVILNSLFIQQVIPVHREVP